MVSTAFTDFLTSPCKLFIRCSIRRLSLNTSFLWIVWEKLSLHSSQWTGFLSNYNRSSGSKFLRSKSYLIAACDVKTCIPWGFKVFFFSSRLSINESTCVLVLFKKDHFNVTFVRFRWTFLERFREMTFWNGQFFPSILKCYF